MFDCEWTKNDQENHCPEDGHSFRPGIVFIICTNQLHLQENDREGLKLFGILAIRKNRTTFSDVPLLVAIFRFQKVVFHLLSDRYTTMIMSIGIPA